MKFLLCLLITIAPVFAKPASKHSCRILFLDGPDSAPDTLQLFDGRKSREVELPRMNLSPVYRLRPGELTLSLLPEPPEDPNHPPPGAPSARIPAEMEDFYLLVTHDPANSVAPVRLSVIPAGPDRLKKGQMLWFNLSTHLVRGTVGAEEIRLRAGSSATMNAPAKGHEDYLVALDFRIKGDKETYPLCETQWFHDPRSRSLAFVISRPGVRTPRVLVFPDFRIEKEEKE